VTLKADEQLQLSDLPVGFEYTIKEINVPDGYTVQTAEMSGTIAADPSIFPYGTQLNVPGYGEGVVEDTGSRVKGFHIDVWFPTHAEAQAWGSREMSVAQPR
jgi:3D (Asp-Asp-Asp) domain-containing protein